MKYNKENKISSLTRRTFRWLIKVIFYLLALLVVLILLLYIPPIQNLITNKAEKVLERKFQTEIHIGAINLNLFGNLIIKDVFIKDPDDQKVFQVEVIDTEVAILPLLIKKIHINYIRISGLKSSLMIDPTGKKTNVDFMISAFSSESSEKKKDSGNWDLYVAQAGLERSFFSLDMPGMMEFSIDLGTVSLKNNTTDLDIMDFDIHTININETDVILKLYNDSLSNRNEVKTNVKKSNQNNNTNSKINRIQISNSSFVLEVEDALNMVSNIGAFEGKTIDVNLLEHMAHAEELELKNSQTRINYQSLSQVAYDSIPDENSTGKDVFINNFNWDIGSKSTQLVDCEFDLTHKSKDNPVEKLLPDNIQLKEINISLFNTILAKRRMGSRINTIRFLLDEGIGMKGMKGEIDYQNNRGSLKDIEIKTFNSEFLINADFSHDPTGKLGDDPATTKFKIRELFLSMDRRDLDYFQSENILKKAGIQHLILDSELEGTLDDFQIGQFRLELDDNNTIDLSGQISNLTKPDKICFGNLIASMNLNTDILYAVSDSLSRDELNLPEEIQISAKIDGCRSDLLAEMQANTNRGENLQILGTYNDQSPMNNDTLSIQLKINGLDLGSLIQSNQVGKIYLNSKASISGVKKDFNHLELISWIDSLEFNHFLASNIQLTASYAQDSIMLHIEAPDSILNFEFDTKGVFVNSVASLTSKLDVNVLDLGRIGITDESIKLSGKLNSKEKYSGEAIAVSLDVKDVSIMSENTFEFDSIRATLHKDSDSISFNIQSSFLSGWFNSTIAPEELLDYLVNFYKHHFVPENAPPLSRQEGSLSFHFTADRSWENLVLMTPGLEDFWFSKIEGKLDELKNTSFITFSVPRIKYRDLSVDSLYFNISSEPAQLEYTLKVPKISYDKYTVNNFNLNGQTDEGIVNNMVFLQDTTGGILIRIGFQFQSAEKNKMVFHINPDSLIFNSKLWAISEDNMVSIGPGRKVFGKMQINDGLQSLSLIASDTLYQINIEDFQLSNISSILRNFNPEMNISGNLNMATDIGYRNEAMRVNSKFFLSDFIFQDTHFGNITMEIGNDWENTINGNILLENGNNILRLEGNYAMDQSSNPFNAELFLDLNETQDFKSFGKEFIQNPKGSIRSNLILTGDKDHLDVNGEIDFNSFNFLLVPNNNTYSINNESISVNENNIVFSDFILKDSALNEFSINGTIKPEMINTFSMDLSLKADQFSAYNVNASNNPYFYGSLIVSMDADIKGTSDNPNIWLDLTIDKGTNLVYALPPKNFDLVDSEGIVEFVNLSDADTAQELRFEQYVGDTIFSKLNWLDLNAVVKIDRSSQFMIDVDPISGDYIQFGGSGNLNLLVQKNQNPRITGTYEFDRGIYEVSFYGLVRKTFEFEPGSIIIWSGDPYSARLNLKATNTIRTASTGLIAREIYGLPDEEKSRYRRTLPYTVEINIAGQVDNPEIKFGINLPQEERNGFPLVDSKLNQLAEPDHESELTRQVFGLLTIGSFIPETTGPGSGGDYGSAFASTAAINSINSILTNELNKLSGKYITFADLDVGMQSFSEVGGGVQSNRTTMDIKLSKKLFDDRVTIEAQGSFDLYNDANKYNHASEQSTVHSDFAIIYDLTKKGDYKLKGFERSAYDIIYKDTRMGGVAVIFIKEFDIYKEERKSEK